MSKSNRRSRAAGTAANEGGEATGTEVLTFSPGAALEETLNEAPVEDGQETAETGTEAVSQGEDAATGDAPEGDGPESAPAAGDGGQQAGTPGVGEVAMAFIKANPGAKSREVIKAVLRVHPDAQTTSKSVAWYRWYMRKHDMLPARETKPADAQKAGKAASDRAWQSKEEERRAAILAELAAEREQADAPAAEAEAEVTGGEVLAAA